MKRILLLVLFVLGFLLMPTNAMACKSKSVTHTSHREKTSKASQEMSCDAESHLKNNKHKCCDGKCGHSKCECSSFCPVFLFFTDTTGIPTVIEHYASVHKFANFETFLSKGFGLLWYIPKIG